MEKLALSIQQKVNSGLWRPVQVSKGGPGLYHLLFANDVLLFCQAHDTQVQVVIYTFTEFCQASGLLVNLDKSRAMCSSKMPRSRRVSFSNISSVRFVGDLGNYLRFPLVQGRVNKNIYNSVLEKMQQRMAVWKSKLLNKAGRICLAKSVTSAIPVYSMQIHYLPTSVPNRIDATTRNFIWSKNGSDRGWHLVNWNTCSMFRRFGA